MKISIPNAALILALISAGSGWAQTIFKSTMPDGSVVYGAAPAPGRKGRELELLRVVDQRRHPRGRRHGERNERTEKTEREYRDRDELRALASTQTERGAEREFPESAHRKRAPEPLPGERIGTAGGASRLTEAYEERQKSLEAAVAAARKRLTEVRTGAR